MLPTVIILTISASYLPMFTQHEFPQCMDSYYALCDQYKAKGYSLDDVLVEITDQRVYCVFPPLNDTECEIAARLENYWINGTKTDAPPNSYIGQKGDWKLKIQEVLDDSYQLIKSI